MAKRPMKLTIRIPEYLGPRNAWRRAIHVAVTLRQRRKAVHYLESDKVEVVLRVFLRDARAANIHDVDNRLKDCLDALQSRFGGSKARRDSRPIIPNDRQIWRVSVEKAQSPKQSRGMGHLTIRRYSTRRPSGRRHAG